VAITVAKQSEDSRPGPLAWVTDPVEMGDADASAGSEKDEQDPDGQGDQDPDDPPRQRSPMFRSSRPRGTAVGYFSAWREDRARGVTHQASFAGSYDSDIVPDTSELLRLAALRVRDNTNDPGEQKLPWVTFVLGSGCLGREHPVLADPTERAQTTVKRLVNQSLVGAWTDDIEIELVRDLTVDFILELALTRAPGRVDEWATQANGVDATEAQLATLASAAAALGTQLFLKALAGTRMTVASAQREMVSLDFSNEDFGGLQHRYLDPLVAVATEFRRLTSEGSSPALKAFADVLAAIRTTESLPRERVEVLGAFAWHFWTDKTTIYPGWSDILLFQAAETRTQNVSKQFLEVPMLRRPNVTQLGNLQPDHRKSWLYLRLLDITQKSWDEGTDSHESDRERFYATVAKSLIQQAALARRHAKTAGAPLATAFVSGFDLELEMALLRNLQNTGGHNKFAIVVPVFHVHTGQASDQSDEAKYDTALCWVWKFVEGKETAGSSLSAPLEGLLDDGEWNYCDTDDASVQRLEELLHGVPVVVRLSGAPLIGVDPDHFADPLPDWRAGHQIRPALLLDENTSLIQVALDLKGWDGRLPDALAQDSGIDDFDRRYWMFVGVQLSDPAVRLRLLSREFSLAWGEVKKRPRGAASDRGVIVNTWAPAAERQLFHWQGFGVVKAEAADITDDVDGLVARTAKSIATQAAQA